MAKLLSMGTAICQEDWDQKIAEKMRALDLLPDVLLFADTNWSGWFLDLSKIPQVAR